MSFANKVVLALVFVSCIDFGSQAAVVKNQVELVFIGRYENPQTSYNGKQAKATTYYFRSQNSAGWTTGENDCRANLGDSATLVYIETPEELAAVTKFLQSSDDTGATYWLGGKYEPSISKFTWNNDIEVGSWAPWDKGHPDTQLSVSKISAYTASGSGLKLRTQFQTVSNRYLCEITP